MSVNNYIFSLVLFINIYALRGSEEPSTREGRLLPVFQVVRFRNDGCNGGSKNGICYTSAECATRGGTNGGACASGFGVCCTFTARCGETSQENCTYFESVGNEQGSCSLKICKCDDSVCQLRLDFQSFMIAGPSTLTDTIGKSAFGIVAAMGEVEVSDQTQCNMDNFSVTNPGGTTPPVICGLNTGEHMYVDASEACNDLVFQFGGGSPGTPSVQRQWSIKVSQIRNGDISMAPKGCTQYFTGTKGVVRSYNFQGKTHLARQNQNICIRRERGMCRICWAATGEKDFQLSGKEAKGFTKGSVCCGYGEDGKKTSGYDCVIIPGAEKKTGKVVNSNAICGRSVGLVDMTMGAAATVCSRSMPFSLRFVSDNFEFKEEAAKLPNQGFQLAYTQDGCT
eukprot:TRINITY_DN26032_c0_g1_i1.p1 TRINITY_DN26032_c0_g1~~TRINITY_DN26032_c0_g1_i1.p1  ORF type:complete len:403 (+),score=38.83 TRINITY_DN26032_c0_g1_i1:23-1210(+)